MTAKNMSPAKCNFASSQPGYEMVILHFDSLDQHKQHYICSSVKHALIQEEVFNLHNWHLRGEAQWMQKRFEYESYIFNACNCLLTV